MSFAKDVSDAAMKHPVMNGAAVLFVMAMVGSSRYYLGYYGEFGLNVFQFASPTDWISLGLGKLKTVAIVLFFCAIPVGSVITICWVDTPQSDRAQTVHGAIFVIGGFILLGVPGPVLGTYAGNDAALQQTGTSSAWLRTVDDAMLVDVCLEERDPLKNVVFIGATSEYMFFYDRTGKSTHIVKRQEVQGMNTLSLTDTS